MTRMMRNNAAGVFAIALMAPSRPVLQPTR